MSNYRAPCTRPWGSLGDLLTPERPALFRSVVKRGAVSRSTRGRRPRIQQRARPRDLPARADLTARNSQKTTSEGQVSKVDAKTTSEGRVSKVDARSIKRLEPRQAPVFDVSGVSPECERIESYREDNGCCRKYGQIVCAVRETDRYCRIAIICYSYNILFRCRTCRRWICSKCNY